MASFPATLKTASAEQRAFWCLLATSGTVAFSIFLGQVFAGLCFLLFAVAVWRRETKVRWPGVMWIATIFAVVAVASVLIGVDPHRLFDKAGKLLWFLLIPVTVSLVTTPAHAKLAVQAFAWGCGGVVLRVVVEHPFRAWRSPDPDFLHALIDTGSMTQGQVLMMGVVATLALWLYSRPDDKGRRMLLLLLVAEVLASLVNFKRGSWFCTLVLAGVLLAVRTGWKVWVGALVTLVIVACLPPVQARMGQLRGEFNVNGGGRLTMWCRIAPYLIEKYPMGVGYGSLTNKHMREAYRRVEPNRNHLHANWAQVLVTTGWLGLGVYLAWMVRTLIDAIRAARLSRAGPADERVAAVIVLLLLAGLLLNGFVEYNFGDTELMLVYAVLMGLAAALAPRSRRSKSTAGCTLCK